tara:strand:- start:142 stop:279 length:138 start_codon:yes stop_codon:yes gene_type:complete
MYLAKSGSSSSFCFYASIGSYFGIFPLGASPGFPALVVFGFLKLV